MSTEPSEPVDKECKGRAGRRSPRLRGVAVGLVVLGSGIALTAYFLPRDEPAPVAQTPTPAPPTIVTPPVPEVRLQEPPEVAGARPITLFPAGPTEVTGRIEPGAEAEMLRMQAKQDGLMVITVKASAGSKLAPTVLVQSNSLLPLSPPNRAVAEFVATAGSRYYLRVAPAHSLPVGRERVGTYVLTCRTEPIASDDFGNDFDSAHPVTLASDGTARLTGRIEVPSDQDCFRIQPDADGWLKVGVRGLLGSQLTLRPKCYDEERQELLSEFPVAKGHRYYVKVAAASSGNPNTRLTGDYELTVRLETSPRDDHGNDFAAATAVTLLATGAALTSGRLETADDVDFFRVQAPRTGVLQITLQPALGSRVRAHLFVFDARRTLLRDTAAAPTLSAEIPIERGQAYYVKVAARAEAVGNERIGAYSIEFKPLPSPR